MGYSSDLLRDITGGNETYFGGMSSGGVAGIIVAMVVVLIVIIVAAIAFVMYQKESSATQKVTSQPVTLPAATDPSILTGLLENGNTVTMDTWIGPTTNGFKGYATICDPCNDRFGDFIGIARTPTDDSKFTIEHAGVNTVSLKCADGTYLGQSLETVTTNAHNDMIINQGHATTGALTDLIVKKVGLDRYTFQFAGSGMYLSVCNGCSGEVTAAGMDSWNNLSINVNPKTWHLE